MLGLFLLRPYSFSKSSLSDEERQQGGRRASPPVDLAPRSPEFAGPDADGAALWDPPPAAGFPAKTRSRLRGDARDRSATRVERRGETQNSGASSVYGRNGYRVKMTPRYQHERFKRMQGTVLKFQP